MKIRSGRRGGAGSPRLARLAVALLTVALGALAAPGGAAAQNGRPVISGSPVLGATLQAQGFDSDADYRWQRCHPANGSCGDNLNPIDQNWATIPDTNSPSYTLQAPDVGHFIRVLAREAPSDASIASLSSFTPSAPVGPVLGPPFGMTPVHGVQVLAEPVSGVVWVKFPGTEEFVALTGPTVLPFGTIVNVRRGRIRIIGATGPFGSTSSDQTIEFFRGVFKLKQRPALDADVIARLVEKLSCGDGNGSEAGAADSGPSAEASARRRRRLWGSGSGKYATRGRGGTGSVIGTTWVQKESCDRATWKVTEGEGITVDPKGRKKDVELEEGEKLSIEI